jgi:hypothetical protein
MTAPKRIALAFGCLLLAFAIFGIVGTVPTLIRNGPSFAQGEIEILPAYFAVAVAGWLLAIPFVILFKDADGWRSWAILAIGTAIGPIFLLTPSLVATGGRISWQAEGTGVAMSLLIGFLTTVFYVLLLRRFKRSVPVNSPWVG